MKFSVLLPTRNRLELLRYAVESVRRQQHDDWEIIISDNDSQQDIRGYAAALNDPRIHYFRTEKLLPVTDNWNNALQRATGEYLIMLGDDDALLPDYFARATKLLEEHDHPDLLYSAGFIYAYPGVMPDQPQGFLHPSGYAQFRQGKPDVFLLDRDSAMKTVRHSLDMQVRFEFNMQYSTIRRGLVESMRPYGPFFQSPFPDFYASNAVLLKAPRILVCAEPLVMIGISPKSYGFFHFNQQDSAGVEFLQCFPDAAAAQRLSEIVLPGSNMNTSWLYAMDRLRQNFGTEFDLPIGYRRYRTLQILDFYQARISGALDPEAAKQVAEKIRFSERMRIGSPIALARLLGKRRALKCIRRMRRRQGQSPPGWKRKLIPQSCKNILEAAEFVAGHPPTA